MKNKLILVFAIAGLLLFSSACNRKMTPNSPSEASFPQKNSDVIIAQNHFAFRLFEETIAQENNDQNKLISPLSLYLDLSMAYNGAADSTKDAMSHAMGLEDVSTKILNETNRALMSTLPKADQDVDMSVANSIWYKNTGVQPLAGFIKTNSQYYQALIKGADFSPNTVTEINHWVAEKTKDKIKSIIQNISTDDVMYLINAVYFKGAWAVPFEPKATTDREFTTKSGSTVKVPFMRQQGRFNYMQNDTVQMVELPYGKGNFNMYVLLPGKNASVQHFVAQLNETTLSSYLGKMDSVKINLWLPKWKYSYEVSDYKPELTTLGMGIAFNPEADFSNMYPKQTPMHISKVVHKAFIEVNEQGTEAAAATSIGVSVTSMPMNPPPTMDVNRPFVYLITEKNSGSILFIGKVNNPAEE